MRDSSECASPAVADQVTLQPTEGDGRGGDASAAARLWCVRLTRSIRLHLCTAGAAQPHSVPLPWSPAARVMWYGREALTPTGVGHHRTSKRGGMEGTAESGAGNPESLAGRPGRASLEGGASKPGRGNSEGGAWVTRMVSRAACWAPRRLPAFHASRFPATAAASAHRLPAGCPAAPGALARRGHERAPRVRARTGRRARERHAPCRRRGSIRTAPRQPAPSGTAQHSLSSPGLLGRSAPRHVSKQSILQSISLQECGPLSGLTAPPSHRPGHVSLAGSRRKHLCQCRQSLRPPHAGRR